MSYNQPPPPGGYPPPPPGYGAPAAPPLVLTLGDALVAGAGLIILIFSFTPFVGSSSSYSEFNLSYNAWESAPTLFVALAGILLIALGLLRRFWPANGVIGFSLNHVQVGVALYVFFNMLAYLFAGGGPGGSIKVGAIFMLLGGIAAAAGAIMNQLGVGGQVFPSAPKAPAGYPPPPPPPAA